MTVDNIMIAMRTIVRQQEELAELRAKVDEYKARVHDLEIDKCDLVCANCHRLRTIKSEAWRNRRPDQPIDNNPTLF